MADAIRSIPLGLPSANQLGKFYQVLGQILPEMETEILCQSKHLTDKAISYMQKNTALKISQVAQLCCVSESSLYAAFQKELSKTPNQVRQQLLVEKATLLLTTTDQSSKQISDNLGFSDVSYFRKLIKSYTGETPMQLRRNMRTV